MEWIIEYEAASTRTKSIEADTVKQAKKKAGIKKIKNILIKVYEIHVNEKCLAKCTSINKVNAAINLMKRLGMNEDITIKVDYIPESKKDLLDILDLNGNMYSITN